MTEVADIHRPFCAWLKRERIPFNYHRPDKRSGMTEGWEDFTLVLHNQCLLIEAKVGKGKLSPKQLEVHQAQIETGSTPIVCRSLEECVSKATEWRDWLNGATTVQRRGTCETEPERRIQFGRKVAVFRGGQFVTWERP